MSCSQARMTSRPVTQSTPNVSCSEPPPPSPCARSSPLTMGQVVTEATSRAEDRGRRRCGDHRRGGRRRNESPRARATPSSPSPARTSTSPPPHVTVCHPCRVGLDTMPVTTVLLGPEDFTRRSTVKGTPWSATWSIGLLRPASSGVGAGRPDGAVLAAPRVVRRERHRAFFATLRISRGSHRNFFRAARVPPIRLRGPLHAGAAAFFLLRRRVGARPLGGKLERACHPSLRVASVTRRRRRRVTVCLSVLGSWLHDVGEPLASSGQKISR